MHQGTPHSIGIHYSGANSDEIPRGESFVLGLVLLTQITTINGEKPGIIDWDSSGN